MAQILEDTQAISTQQSKKERKKQAKREAKLMLKVEKGQKEVKKAERKVSKAQADLETSKGRLHKSEEKLTGLRAAQDSHNGVAAMNYEPVATTAEADAATIDEQPQAQEGPDQASEVASEQSTDDQGTPNDEIAPATDTMDHSEEETRQEV